MSAGVGGIDAQGKITRVRDECAGGKQGGDHRTMHGDTQE
jgi:hypothetical protein